jgi:hypothetical protein
MTICSSNLVKYIILENGFKIIFIFSAFKNTGKHTGKSMRKTYESTNSGIMHSMEMVWSPLWTDGSPFLMSTSGTSLKYGFILQPYRLHSHRSKENKNYVGKGWHCSSFKKALVLKIHLDLYSTFETSSKNTEGGFLWNFLYYFTRLKWNFLITEIWFPTAGPWA